MHIVWASTITSCFRRVFLLGPRAQNNIWCVYLEIRTIVGVLAYRRLSTNPSCHRSPSPLILSNVSISERHFSVELPTRSSRTWKALSSSIQSWILSHQGQVGRNCGGSVLIVMHARSHMTVDNCLRTNQGRDFTDQAIIASTNGEAP